MRLKPSFLWVAASAVVLVLAIAGYLLQREGLGPQRHAAPDFAVDVTPPGITLTTLANPGEQHGLTHLKAIPDFLRNGETVFSDAKGMTYYTYDPSAAPGKASCSGDCLTGWLPGLAQADAQPVGAWSLVAREDGSKQWAYKGKPVFTFDKDAQPGDAKGAGLAEGAWHTSVFKPASMLTQLIGHTVFKPEVSGAFPFGISVQEVADAGGQVLIDERGRTLYAFGGDPKEDKPTCAKNGPCGSSPWIPIYAAALAGSVGDFTIVKRADAKNQWAYKGWPLYRYTGDIEANQANAVGVDERWRPAVVLRYPVPAQVSVQSTIATGKIFATAEGRSLYRQHIYYYSFGHDFQHGTQYYEAIGRVLGTRGCDSECGKAWHPFVPAPNAQPSGHWSIVTRSDGTRQWAYKGYALYTFEGDKKPGDLLGRDTWNISWTDPSLQKVSLLNTLKINAETITGVVWTTVYP